MISTVYCAVNLVRGGPLSLALVHPDGRWLYAEPTDIAVEPSEAEARSRARLRSVPGTTFSTLACLDEHVALFLDQVLPSGTIVLEVAHDGSAEDSPALRVLASAASKSCHALSLKLKQAVTDPNSLADFRAHCGGEDRIQSHALINAISLALCSTQELTDFFSQPFHRLEMLLGSKNAMSLRAWVREHERGLRQALALKVA
jgi:hypothetical protein